MDLIRYTIHEVAMDRRYQIAIDQPPEITSLDARIANAGGTSSRVELQPHRLRETKTQRFTSTTAQIDDLIRENGYLRQEIVFHQESRNGMLAFHNEILDVYQGLQSALKALSEKMARAEGRIERYWGVPTGSDNKDVTVV